jgi:hypothetical protein
LDVNIDSLHRNSIQKNIEVDEVKKLMQQLGKSQIEKWLGNTLTDKEVLQAQKRIDEMYPLGNIPIEILFPYLKVFNKFIIKYRKWKT